MIKIKRFGSGSVSILIPTYPIDTTLSDQNPGESREDDRNEDAYIHFNNLVGVEYQDRNKI